MPASTPRFSRGTFPVKRPLTRHTFSWGSVSLYPPPARAAVVVSKKTLKKAHDRNRVRRRLYAAYAASGGAPSHAAVLFPRREALTAPFAELVRDLKALGQK